MRIWCFSCFGNEQQEEKAIYNDGGVCEIVNMSGNNSIAVVRNDDNSADIEQGFVDGLGLGPVMRLGDFGNDDSVDNEGLIDLNVDGNRNNHEVRDSELWLSNHSGSNYSPGMMDMNLNLALGGGSSSSSTSMLLLSACAVDDEVMCARDLHNKRPKVQSLTLDWDSHFEGEINRISPMCEDGDIGNQIESGNSSKSSEGNDNISVQADDVVHIDLTDDLLHMVFSFLEHVDLCRASIVCRQWRAAGSHEDFWRKFDFDNKRITEQQFGDMCRRYPNAVSVNICDATLNLHLLGLKAISLLRNLEVLSLGKGLIMEDFFDALTECSMLKKLTITEATLGNNIHEIVINQERLRSLQLVKCKVLRVSIRCPQLETLSLKRSTMPHAVLNCPVLRNLDIASCHKLPDTAIRSAAISCPLLESLEMANCTCVTDETLREIASACANLQILDASYCPNISLESVRMPMLTVLKLHFGEGITSASIAAISHSYALEILELDNCNLLTSVTLDLPRLKSIRLMLCRKFVDLTLCGTMLSSITISNCASLQRINLTSRALKKLVLQKQESLTTLVLNCPSLEEVDLTECEALKNPVCAVFSDGGGCPMLKSLILDHCESLTDVCFISSSLVVLSLTGCRAINSLTLKCPFLDQVSLDGCDHLEKALFCPVGLKSLNLGICPKLIVLHVEASQLASLELKGCGVLSEASINCPNLISLDASFCSQLKDDCLSATASSCPSIESLILMSCPSLGSDGLLALQWLPSLTYLDLSYTFLVDMQPVFKSCIHLKVLKLQACKYLVDWSLKPLYKEGALPALRELDLSYGTLSQMAIEELLACCTRLTHVSLNGCVNMHDLNWDFKVDHPPGGAQSDMASVEDVLLINDQPTRMLQHLNCVGCPNIKKVVIPREAECLHLLSFNLSLSANLKEVDIVCSNLSLLNLSNCCSLEILKLKCPKLSSLFLQSCNIGDEAVRDAISSCSMLETLDVRFCSKIYTVSMGKLRAACPSLKRIFNSLFFFLNEHIQQPCTMISAKK